MWAGPIHLRVKPKVFQRKKKKNLPKHHINYFEVSRLLPDLDFGLATSSQSCQQIP